MEKFDRYYIETYQQTMEIIAQIKNGETKNVITVLFLNSDHIKKFTWFLLRDDISYERKPGGSGIAIFHVDTTLNYFVKPKKRKTKWKKDLISVIMW